MKFFLFYSSAAGPLLFGLLSTVTVVSEELVEEAFLRRIFLSHKEGWTSTMGILTHTRGEGTPLERRKVKNHGGPSPDMTCRKRLKERWMPGKLSPLENWTWRRMQKGCLRLWSRRVRIIDREPLGVLESSRAVDCLWMRRRRRG